MRSPVIFKLRYANSPVDIQEIHPCLPTEALIRIGRPLQLEADVALVTLLILIAITGSRAVGREERRAVWSEACDIESRLLHRGRIAEDN